MALMPTYKEWMKKTYSLRHKRSAALVELDEAIKANASQEKLRNLLAVWIIGQQKKGKDWRKSVRNQKGAVTELYRVVNEMDKRVLRDDEREALKYLSRMQARALEKQFIGKKLTFKSTTLVGIARGNGSKWQRFKTGATKLKGGASTAKSVNTGVKNIRAGAKLLKEGGRAGAQAASAADWKKQIFKLFKTLAPGLNPDEVFNNLGLGSVSQFAGNVAPFFGAISSGKKALVGWAGVAKTAYKKHDIASRRYAFAPEDPEAAFDAVLELLRRDVNSRSIRAGVASGAFTGKLLGTFADAGAVTGPVLGLLETLAEISQTIIEYVRDYKEVEEANRLIAVGYLNLDLFSYSPILGCYFLLIQDHSTIINFAVGDYGTPNFKFDAEQLIKKINPVLDQARLYVYASRYEIIGFEGMKGVVKQNWKTKKGLSKVTSAPAAVVEKLSSKIDDWIEKPEKPRKWYKSRIQAMTRTRSGGYGHV